MNSRIIQIRSKIDAIDQRIIRQLGQRGAWTQQIGALKKRAGTNVTDTQREKQIARLHAEWAKQYGVDPALVATLFNAIVRASKKKQRSL